MQVSSVMTLLPEDYEFGFIVGQNLLVPFTVTPRPADDFASPEIVVFHHLLKERKS